MVTNKDLIALAVLLGVAFYLKKKIVDAGAVATDAAKWVADAAQSTWQASAGAVDTGVSAVVYTAGDTLGIPRTNMTACEQAMAEGRTFDASYMCPASDFIKYLAK